MNNNFGYRQTFHPSNGDDSVSVNITIKIVDVLSDDHLSLIDVDNVIDSLKVALEYYQALYDQKAREIDSYWL